MKPAWLINPLFRWGLIIVTASLAGVVGFQLLGFPLLDQVGLPHEYCYLQEPRLIWLNVLSDASIGLAYVSISITLAILVYRASKDIPFNGVFLAFGLFIVSCGLTHFMEVWVVWQPMYWLSGYIKLFTAIASGATALALLPLVPKIFALIDAARKGEQRRKEIEQLNQELERFNYSVAHDLRAPLRGISGLGNALREDFGPDLPPLAQEYVRRMEESAGRMNELISDLLRYSTIGRQEIAHGTVSLDEVLRVTEETLAAEIGTRGGEILRPRPLPAVWGDATLLQVIFQNLLSNALKFVGKGVRPRIEITAEVQDSVARVFVIDNGIGIPAGSRERIFRMFERVNPEYPGTGIGLAIVYRAVERLHGKIEVRDAANGQGACFCLQVPLRERTLSTLH